MSFEERLSLLATHELLCRDNTRVQKFSRQAKLRIDERANHIDYRANRGLREDKIAALLSCHYLHYNPNIILTHATCCGKTYLACALATQAAISITVWVTIDIASY
jgi:DNA replication protein DnaC